MKCIIILVALCTMLTSCRGQESAERRVAKTYHKNGKIFTETEVIGGKKNGMENIYHDNGNIMYRQYFQDDMFVDSFFQYSKDNSSTPEIIGYFTPISRFHAFDYQSKSLVGTTDYKKNAVAEGVVKLYYSNGKVMSTTEYVDGKREGVEILYFLNGNVQKIKHYVGGELKNPIIEFDSSGKLLRHTLLN